MRALVLLLSVLVLIIQGTQSYNKNQFGHHLRSQFALASDYTNLNHGSFGTAPLYVLEKQRELTERMEARPDIWFRAGAGSYREDLTETREIMAQYLNVSDASKLVIVESASTGVNAVFRSLKFEKGDKILITSTAYPMVKNLVTYFEQRDGAIRVEVPIQFPLSSNDEIIQPVLDAIAEHGNTIKFASFSHIDSVPGFILPVNDLIRHCRAAGIKTLIDGAHSLGQVPLNLDEMDPDYFTASGHKWFYSPKGTAVLYVRDELKLDIVPTVIASEFQLNTFHSNFDYVSTRDYTGFLSFKHALEFRASLGTEEEIMGYLHDLALSAGSYLSSLWKTRTIVPEYMVGGMIDVQFPTDTLEEANVVRDIIFQEFGINFVVHSQHGIPYTRLSAQVYLELSDFQDFGAKVLQVISRK